MGPIDDVHSYTARLYGRISARVATSKKERRRMEEYGTAGVRGCSGAD
jgi:hypothetical protein